MAELTGEPLTSTTDFNWVFLVELVVCGIAALFFLFYFNRLFATLVSYGIRAYSWHKYRVYIDIEALQLSLLGGRILFKGFRYHGINETIYVHDGNITWQYWFRKVKDIDKARIKHHAGNHGGSDGRRDNKNQTGRPEVETYPDNDETGGVQEVSRLPHRISVSVRGLEWFIYNRSPAYDGIVSQLEDLANSEKSTHDHFTLSSKLQELRRDGDTSKGSNSQKTGRRQGKWARKFARLLKKLAFGLGTGLYSLSYVFLHLPFPKLKIPTSISNPGQRFTAQEERNCKDRFNEPLGILKILPIRVQCQKGAFVLGNESTRCLLTVKFSNAVGELDAGEAGPLDNYRQLIVLDVSEPIIQLRPNPDFKDNQIATAERLRNPDELDIQEQKLKRRYFPSFKSGKHQIWHALQVVIPYFRTSVESLHPGMGSQPDNYRKSHINPSFLNDGRWTGLTRYLDENDVEIPDRWTNVEYARSSTIVDCPSVEMTIYWDVPGFVPPHSESMYNSGAQVDNINGDLPPEWGINMRIRGGEVCYGPWADRQRADIQSIFFPNPFLNFSPALKLAPGSTRVSTRFRLCLEIENEVTVRLPTREASKDWQWKWQNDHANENASQHKSKTKRRHFRLSKTEQGISAANTRSFGWLALRVAQDSTITYTTDLVAGSNGFDIKLDLDLKSTNMSSSVNHGQLWQCGPQKFSCDFSVPLNWDDLRSWKFKVISEDMEMFLLRDHMFLLTDLIGDWASGPPADFYTFVPFHYSIDLQFSNLKLYLNVNDANIIDNPSDLEDNTYVIIGGESLTASVDIPIHRFNPSQNQISFNACGNDLKLELSLPVWNTQDTFLDNKSIGSLKILDVSGYYNYHMHTSATLTDTLFLEIGGTSPTFTLFGFAIRYLMKVKVNYFGEDLHFKTLEEYKNTFVRSDTPPLTDGNLQPHKIINDLDVILSISVDKMCALFPSHLYSSKEELKVDGDSVKADLRFTNYYMDLEANFSPLSLSSRKSAVENGMSKTVSSTALYVDGFNIYGHRLFGLPPTEPTYVCNWDFDIARISGECSTDFIRTAVQAGSVFMFSLDDRENSLPSVHPAVLHDVTFLRVRCQPLSIWVHIYDDALLLSAAGISFDYNNRANHAYSEKSHLIVPDLVFSSIDRQSAIRHKAGHMTTVQTYAWLQTTLDLAVIERKSNFSVERALQQDHVLLHDQRTQRTSWLLPRNILDDHYLKTRTSKSLKPPAMTFPQMPEPILNEAEITQKASSAFLSRRFAEGEEDEFADTHGVYPKSDNSTISSKRSVVQRYSGLSTGSKTYHQRPKSSLSHATSLLTTSAFADETNGVDFIPSSLMSHSSSWSSPYFPLQGVEPDTEEAPQIPSFDEGKPADFLFQEPILPSSNEDVVHQSIILDFHTGLRGYFSPRLVYTISRLAELLQPKDPSAMLDKLQIDAISQIQRLAQIKLGEGSILDLHLLIPYICIRFMDPYNNHYDAISEVHRDQYDISLKQVSLSAQFRDEANAESTEYNNHTELLHASIKGINVLVQEQFSQDLNDKMAIRGNIVDMMFWLSSKDSICSNLNVKGVELITSSAAVPYLASLAFRVKELAESLAAEFTSVAESQKQRLRHLAYNLAIVGAKTPNPSFLTKHSGVLSAADRHLRNHDSWKIIARFRNIYQLLDLAEKKRFVKYYLENNNNCPAEAESEVIESFNTWRGWDLNHIKQSCVMEKIWGLPPDETKTQSKEHFFDKYIQVTVTLGDVSIILDHEPKQNEVRLDGLFCGVDIPSSVSYAEDSLSSSREVIINVYAFSHGVSVRLNWELCELAEDMLKLYTSKDNLHPTLKPVPKNEPFKVTHQIHAVFGVDIGTITLDGIHLELLWRSNGLKGSIIQQGDQNSSEPYFSSVLLSADMASLKAFNHSQLLAESQIQHPSTSLSRIIEYSGSPFGTNTWKLACASESLTIDVQEDVLSLLEITNGVIVDEVRHIHRLVTHGAMQDGVSTPTTTSSHSSTFISPRRHKFTVALFLDVYKINIALFQSLNYVISGTVARTSISPLESSSHAIDFDFHEQTHEFRNNEAESMPLLQMPPINGRVIVTRQSNETSFNISTTFENIMLDAAAVHGVISTISRPEVSAVLNDIREAGKAIGSEVEKIFGSPNHLARQDQSNVATKVIYQAHVAIAGLVMHVSTRGKDESITTVDFHFGSVQMRTANRRENSSEILKYPELRLHLHEILFELSRTDDSLTRSCGNLQLDAYINLTSSYNESHILVRAYQIESKSLEINVFAETAPLIIDVLGDLQNKLKGINLSPEAKHLRRLRRLTRSHISFLPRSEHSLSDSASEKQEQQALFSSMYSLEMCNVQVSWIVGRSISNATDRAAEDLVLSFKRIDLATQKENAARLMIQDLQLQMVPPNQKKTQRSMNSALLPEVLFNVAYFSTNKDWRIAFQAAAKSLDLRLTSDIVIPASMLEASISTAMSRLREAMSCWAGKPSQSTTGRRRFFGKKKLSSLLIDADFGGAVVYIQRAVSLGSQGLSRNFTEGSRFSYSKTSSEYPFGDSGSSTTLRFPGVALKIGYKDSGLEDPSLNAEIRVDASSNILYPGVVPILLEMSSSIQEVVGKNDETPVPEKVKPVPEKDADDKSSRKGGPSLVLGRCRLNMGLHVCRQEFSLSCQPIARVASTGRFEDIYFTVNTVQSEQNRFYSISTTVSHLQASVQHVYSRESTASFDVQSIVLSVMNSKHVSGVNGLSAIAKLSPMRIEVNAKQLQDFMLFREIWLPQNKPTMTNFISTTSGPQTIMIQRYQEVAAAGAFAWNAIIAIDELDIQVDLGQALGKPALTISRFWVSSKKSSKWEQNLCLGFDKISVDSNGRMSGSINLDRFRVRGSIKWPSKDMEAYQTPLVQASVGFDSLRVKGSFDYQAFLIANIGSFEVLMYNVREKMQGDRLVGILEGNSIQVFGTATSASEGLALYQAFLRLVQEKQTAFESSLRDVEKFLRRKSSGRGAIIDHVPTPQAIRNADVREVPISLQTDVVATLKSINIAIFPGTFFDNQVFKLEASDAQARFAAILEDSKVHSGLGLTLGQLRVALSSVHRSNVPKALGDVSVDEVVSNVAKSRGGIILQVPKVIAKMQTWQVIGSNQIEYIFKSSFEGKVDVGWNYSRISFIRTMWMNHTKSLAHRLGRPIPQSAVRFTGGPQPEGEGETQESDQGKITAVVSVPQSKFEYLALEPPVIETPQLRDMGEATPPLEWIGLHRDRLPNVTHQLIIVTLLKVVKEVEDAYSKILGST